MALTQYNNWEPTLDAVSGNMAREPRVFSHDAFAIVQGAINYSASDKGITITNGGSGYSVGDTLTEAAAGGGSGLVLKVLKETGGVVTDFEFSELTLNNTTSAGSGYSIGEALTFTGGDDNFTATVSNIDIPNTQKRGCCVYIGASAGITSLSVTMESGRTAVFQTLSAGSILPILVKRVNTAITGNDVIALF